MANYFGLVAKQAKVKTIANIYSELKRGTNQQEFGHCRRQVEAALPTFKLYNLEVDNSSSPNLNLPRCKDITADFAILESLENELAPEVARNYP
jgi:hypothetical protein